MHKYKLLKKAYWVGSSQDLRMIGHPECGAVDIIISAEDKPSVAKKLGWKELKYDSDIGSYLDIRLLRAKSEDRFEFEGKPKSIYRIKEIIATRENRNNLENILLENKDKKCYIWSGQWVAYWRPNSSGYTCNLDEAGIYSVEESVKIGLGCGIEKKIELKVIKI